MPLTVADLAGYLQFAFDGYRRKEQEEEWLGTILDFARTFDSPNLDLLKQAVPRYVKYGPSATDYAFYQGLFFSIVGLQAVESNRDSATPFQTEIRVTASGTSQTWALWKTGTSWHIINAGSSIPPTLPFLNVLTSTVTPDPTLVGSVDSNPMLGFLEALLPPATFTDHFDFSDYVIWQTPAAAHTGPTGNVLTTEVGSSWRETAKAGRTLVSLDAARRKALEENVQLKSFYLEWVAQFSNPVELAQLANTTVALKTVKVRGTEQSLPVVTWKVWDTASTAITGAYNFCQYEGWWCYWVTPVSELALVPQLPRGPWPFCAIGSSRDFALSQMALLSQATPDHVEIARRKN